MHKANILPIALIAFAIVGFLFMVDYSISGGKWPWSVNTTKTVTNSAANTQAGSNVNVGTNSNVNTGTDTLAKPGYTESANKTTYVNTEYNFSFVINAVNVCSPVSCPPTGNTVLPSNISVHVAELGTATTARSWLETAGAKGTGITLSASSLGGISGSTFEAVNPVSTAILAYSTAKIGTAELTLTKKSRGVAVIHNSYVYIVIFQNGLGVVNPDVTTFNDIVQSFSFTSPTADWKTYTAPTAGYSFKYPSGLGNAEIQGGGYLGVLEGSKAQEWEANLLVIDSDRTTQIVYFYTPIKNIDPSTSLQNSIPDEWRNDKLYSKSKTTLDGVEFDKYLALSDGYSGVKEGYAVTKNNRHYIISLQENRLALAKEILSTFTFVETDTRPSAQKETYVNTSLGYSVQYPMNWKKTETSTLVTFSGISGTNTPYSTPMVRMTTQDSLYPKDSCLVSETTVIVAGVNRTRQIEGCSYAGGEIATFIPKDAGYIKISWTEDVQSAYSTYDEILSTFTFTK